MKTPVLYYSFMLDFRWLVSSIMHHSLLSLMNVPVLSVLMWKDPCMIIAVRRASHFSPSVIVGRCGSIMRYVFQMSGFLLDDLLNCNDSFFLLCAVLPTNGWPWII